LIVDTSALIAVLNKEDGHEALRAALSNEPKIMPAPTRLEFSTVATNPRFKFAEKAQAYFDELIELGMETLAWDARHAAIAAEAQLRYGKGNGRGGVLNLLDLMVYAVAKERDEALLFAGRDFTTTDVMVHPASQVV
jgi:ribonuclease VapC